MPKFAPRRLFSNKHLPISALLIVVVGAVSLSVWVIKPSHDLSLHHNRSAEVTWLDRLFRQNEASVSTKDASGHSPFRHSPTPSEQTAGLVSHDQHSREIPVGWNPRNTPDHLNGSDVNINYATEETEEIQNKVTGSFISGWVRDTAGQPVLGMTVSGRLKNVQNDQVHKVIAPPSALSTVTGGDGAFLLKPAVAGEYELRTAATTRYATVSLVVRSDTEGIVLVAPENQDQQAYIYGRVESRDGRLLSGTRIAPAGIKTAAFSDTEGNYQLWLPVNQTDKTYTLRFIQEGYRHHHHNFRAQDLAGGDSYQLDVRLEPIAHLTTVNGTLNDANGGAIQGATVQMTSLSTKHSYRGLSDRAGRFVLEEVEVADDYRLWVHSKTNYKEYLEYPVAINGATQMAIVLESAGLGALNGQMVNLSDQPVSNFTLWVRGSSDSKYQYRQVTSDARGYFSIDDIPEGSVSLVSRSAPTISVSGIQLLAGTVKNVQLTIDVGIHRVTGFVVNDKNEAISGAQVSLQWVYQKDMLLSNMFRETAADAGGHFQFSQVGPGRHTLIIEAPGYRSQRLEFEVSSEGDDITIHLVEART